ncbi:MAG TPA: alpha/beta fold hydrolase [Burkholderiales bacterium]|nr:alpha/beta fold hydrolase [Burkholderiales bacterium]
MGWNRVSRTGLVRRLAAALLAGSVLSAAGCAYLDLKQREWIFRAQRDVQAMPSDYGLKYEEVWLTVPGDDAGARERIYAWWIPGPDAHAPAVLYLHGTRWSLSNNLFRIQRLQRMGFAVLAIDYRGFGRSDGDLPSEAYTYADAQAAWEYLRERAPDPHRRFVYGHSLGGAVAIELATHNDDVAGLVADSTFTSMRDMAEVMGYGELASGPLLTQRFDSLARIGSVKAPVLFIHGNSDRFVPAAMSEKLYGAAPEPKRLLLVESGNHRDAPGAAPEKFRAAVLELVSIAQRTAEAATRMRAAAGRGG